MNVELKIITQTRNFNKDIYLVEVFRVSETNRTCISVKQGTIPEIKKQLEDEFGTSVEIEKSVFQGWY